MKEKWQTWGGLFLFILMISSMIFTDSLFGVYGQPIENMIIGISCLVMLTIEGEWFGSYNLRTIAFTSVGILNIVGSIWLFSII